MTTETMVISVRNELVSGLMACAQGLDVRSIDLNTSAADLAALLAESTVLNLRATMFKHDEVPTPWLGVTWKDDAELAWNISVYLTADTFVEFFEANDVERWTTRGKASYAVLTDAELRLTIEKEITRNGA